MRPAARQALGDRDGPQGAAHAACVIDTAGAVLARIEVRHDAAGLADMLARLARIGPPPELPVAIERPSGLIIAILIEVGHPVIPIHSNVVKPRRPRYRACSGKPDPADAFMLADILRTVSTHVPSCAVRWT